MKNITTPLTPLPNVTMITMKRFLFGGISCMCAAALTNPIDVLKVQLQLKGELLTKASSSSVQPLFRGSLTNTVKELWKSEGIKGFYRGVFPSILREGSYSTLRMGLYEPFKGLFVNGEVTSTNLAIWQKLIAGGMSGMIGSAIANPTDLVKVRMQAVDKSGEGKRRYPSTLKAFSMIYRKEGGLAGLYRGVGPTTQRAAILTATQLTSYDQGKHWIIKKGWVKEGLSAHFLASMFAGLMVALTTSPVDLVKSRYMNQKFVSGRGVSYASTLDCFRKTVQAEGPFALYKGFLMNWIRIGPHTITTFIIFEQLRKWSGMPPV